MPEGARAGASSRQRAGSLPETRPFEFEPLCLAGRCSIIASGSAGGLVPAGALLSNVVREVAPNADSLLLVVEGLFSFGRARAAVWVVMGPGLGMNPRLRQALRFGRARLGREWRQSPTPRRRSGGGHVSSVSGTGPAALLAAAVAIEAVDPSGSLVREKPPGVEPASTSSICFVPGKIVHTRFAVFRHDVAVRRGIPRRRCERAPGCRFRFLLDSPGPHSRASPCPLGRTLAFRGGGAADRIRA